MESVFQPGHFARVDEGPDEAFYALPRLVAHIDSAAVAAVERLYAELLPPGSDLLDLMSSCHSHMPGELAPRSLTGLGLNAVELRENPQLTKRVVHNLNADPRLPFGDASCDAAVITVSVQYLTRPVDVVRDLARILRPGAPLVVTYSNRMFPTKAVSIWRELSDRDRAKLVAKYFELAGGYGPVSARDCTLPTGGYNDPLFGVWAYRSPHAGGA